MITDRLDDCQCYLIDLTHAGWHMRRAARRDDNEQEIVKALRRAGAYVAYIDTPADLIVGYRGRTIIMEVKDGRKPPSARKLTDNEQKFHDEWTGGELHIVTCIEEAIDILNNGNYHELASNQSV